MNKSVISGAILASAVAIAFAGTNVWAQNSGGSSTTAQAAKVKCIGGNDCSGKSACKTASSPGPGQNSCKGQGFVMTSSDKECKDMGGKPQSM